MFLEITINEDQNLVLVKNIYNNGKIQTDTNKILTNQNGYIITEIRKFGKESENYEININNSSLRWNYYENYKNNLKLISFGNWQCKNKVKIAQDKQNEIMFTIKDKREQCEAIGFKPETEKFADCVLRLVELDVKKQQSNKIAQAQQSGNDALVKQLQRQQYDRDTDALLSLGQQLLNPGTTNSNIYMPQTQRCTIQGFGTFAKMVCR